MRIRMRPRSYAAFVTDVLAAAAHAALCDPVPLPVAVLPLLPEEEDEEDECAGGARVDTGALRCARRRRRAASAREIWCMRCDLMDLID